MEKKESHQDEKPAADPPAQSADAVTRPIWRRILARFCDKFDAMVFFTIIIAFAAFVNAWAYIQSQRAFVFPSELSLAEKISDGKLPFSFSLVVKNHGRTVATIKEILGFITVDPLPPVPDYRKGDRRIKIAFPPIPPNGTIRRTLSEGSGPLMKQTTDEVFAGIKKFSLFGRIKYRDEYSGLVGERESRFCFQFIPDKSVFDTCPDLEYTQTR